MSRHETTGRNVAMIGNTAKNEGRRYWRKGRHSPSTGGLTKNKSENFFPPPCFRSRLLLPLQETEGVSSQSNSKTFFSRLLLLPTLAIFACKFHIMSRKIINNWKITKGAPLTELDKKILYFQNHGCLVPSRELIKTPEQIEGIRRSGVVNTGVLDLIESEIKAGMSTAEIDRMAFDYTVSHGAIPAPLNYEGFPKSVCTSINEVVCHGIPSEDEILQEGDIINVDVSTILDGYYSDASRMFIIGKTTPEKEKLVRVTKECLEIGMRAAKPFGFVGDIGNAIQRHAEKNGFSVVRDLCGHGVGLAFHEEPEVLHFGRKGTGMLLVPGMVFTIEPMINMGDWHVFIDEDDGWTVVTDDEKPSAQWEHTFLMTENGLEILTY